ncbi:MAG TPA: ribosomal-protein-alanine N-acetyltransferase [Erysipelotrichaceae bacterium]|nr:ribosomal-protein-alanine N-acetyltransferase [Erysipelotrichaceae bacterium]
MIRKMTKEDLPRILELEAELFPSSPWPEHEFIYELDENPFADVRVYEEDGKILGYIDWWVTYEQAQLANIAVASEAHRRGIGQKMIDLCVNECIKAECENLSLEVRVNNMPAIRLYEKNGFIAAGIRKAYYEDGTDAWLMVKPLGGLEYDDNITGN